MYRLEFENEYGKNRLVGKFETVEEAKEAVAEDLNSKGVKPLLYRTWGNENKMTIDYGSYVRFYHIIKEN